MQHLETPRLVLRQFAADDWDAVKAMLADPVATRFMHFGAWTEDESRRWFDWCVADTQHPDTDPLFWAIIHKSSRDVIGWLGIETTSEPAASIERHVGYLLHRAAWNQGYMTEALGAVLANELGTRATPVLLATCNVTNPASARVLEKVGMRRVKTVFDIDFTGKRVQEHHYAITKAEFEARE